MAKDTIELTKGDDHGEDDTRPEGDRPEEQHDLIDEVNTVEQGVDTNPCHHDHGRTDYDEPSDDSPARAPRQWRATREMKKEDTH